MGRPFVRPFECLSNHFPSTQIFMDVDSVDLGEDFVKTIEITIGSCDVLIAAIGFCESPFAQCRPMFQVGTFNYLLC